LAHLSALKHIRENESFRQGEWFGAARDGARQGREPGVNSLEVLGVASVQESSETANLFRIKDAA
jgi:hypothetical protein